MATLKQDAMIVAGIGLGVVVIAWYLKTKVTEAATAIPNAIGDAWAASIKGADNWLLENVRNPVYEYVHKAEPMNDGSGRLINYTDEQRRRDEEAMRRFHNIRGGM